MTAESTLIRQRLLPLALAIALIGAAGCTTAGYERAERTSIAIDRAAADLRTAQQQLARATSALNQLVDEPSEDLRPEFEHYQAAVGDLERTASALDRQANELRDQRLAYLDRWEQQNQEIRSDDIRDRSLQRRDEVAQELAQLEESYRGARETMIPLLRDLQDVQRMLSVDLTPAGLAGARDIVDQARRNIEPARSALADVEQQFRAASVRLEPQTQTTAE